MVFGANTYRLFARMLAASTEESEVRDPWVTRMRSLPATVVSTTLEGSLDWPDADLRQRRCRRGRRSAQGGVRGTVALTRQLVDEPGADGRRTRRPCPGDALPRDHRSNRAGPDLPGLGRLRPRADRAAGPSTKTSKSSSTGPPCTSESRHAPPGISCVLTDTDSLVVEPPLGEAACASERPDLADDVVAVAADDHG